MENNRTWRDRQFSRTTSTAEKFRPENGHEPQIGLLREILTHDGVHDVVGHGPEAGGWQDEEVAEEQNRARGGHHQAEAGLLVHEGADDAEAVEGGDGDEVEDDREELEVAHRGDELL